MNSPAWQYFGQSLLFRELLRFNYSVAERMLMKRLLLFLLIVLSGGVTMEVIGTNTENLPKPIHHFDFSGDLRDRVTGQSMYISLLGTPKREWEKSMIRMVPDSVTFVDTEEGEKTAIKIRPMEFDAKLNVVDCPKITVSMLVRFDEDGMEDKNNSIYWFRTLKYDKGSNPMFNEQAKREYKTRGILGEYHTNGRIEPTGDDVGLTFPMDEWVWMTVVLDEESRSRIVYLKDRFTQEECRMPLDSTAHTGRVGLFHESMHCLISGSVSELKIYDRVLSEDEIAVLHGVDSFDEFDTFDAYLPFFTFILILSIIPLSLLYFKPWRIKRLETDKVEHSYGDNNLARNEINSAIEIWYKSTGARCPYCSNESLAFHYPRGIRIPFIRKHIINAINAKPSDPETIERINLTVDAFNASIRYRFNGSVIYIIIVFLSMFFQEAFDGSHTIFTSEDMTFWGAVGDTFEKHWKLMVLLIPYVLFSMGWSLIGKYGKDIETTVRSKSPAGAVPLKEKIKEIAHSGAGIFSITLSIAYSVLKTVVLWMYSTIMWGIRNSREIVVYKRGGTVVRTEEGVNVVMFFAGFMVVFICLAIVYFLLTFMSIFISLSVLLVIPYKIIRNYILHM